MWTTHDYRASSRMWWKREMTRWFCPPSAPPLAWLASGSSCTAQSAEVSVWNTTTVLQSQPAVKQNPAPSTQCSFQLSFSSYTIDSLELPSGLPVEYCYLPELEEKLSEIAQPRALLYTAAQSLPAGWQNHQLCIVASGRKATYCQWLQHHS